MSDKLDERVKLDIIEKVSGPRSWVLPVVVVPKPSGDIRLCVDMRQANMAVKRERHPIHTYILYCCLPNGAFQEQLFKLLKLLITIQLKLIIFKKHLQHCLKL